MTAEYWYNNIYRFFDCVADMDKPSQDRIRRDAFLSIVSHELKTPITSIQGFTQAMQRRIFQKIQQYYPNTLFTKAELERHHDNLQTVLKQIKRMNRLIDELLDVSVIEHGTLPVIFSTVDLIAVIQDVVARMQEHSLNHKISMEIPKERSFIVLGDEARLDQLFSNIIANSIKFTPDNGKIIVAASESESQFIIKIIDNGIGIAEEQLEYVFDLYYRGNDVGNRKMSGLGLGLYLSKKIVEVHHGEIVIESVVNKGTTVTILMPKYSA